MKKEKRKKRTSQHLKIFFFFFPLTKIFIFLLIFPGLYPEPNISKWTHSLFFSSSDDVFFVLILIHHHYVQHLRHLSHNSVQCFLHELYFSLSIHALKNHTKNQTQIKELKKKKYCLVMVLEIISAKALFKHESVEQCQEKIKPQEIKGIEEIF